MPAINKTPPLSLAEPVNGTVKAENVEQTQINKHDTQVHDSEEQKQMIMLLLLLLLQEPQAGSRNFEEDSEIRGSHPEDHRKEIQEQVNPKLAHNEYNTNSRKKRASKGRVFQCKGYPDCNMSFTRSEHLAKHKRKHTGERPFTCPHCHKNFSRLDNLRQHKQTVHAYEKFMDGSSSNIPIPTNYNPGGAAGNTADANNTSNYIPIPSHLSKFSGVNKGTSESPLNSSFGNSPVSTAMISPPNTNSPANYQLPYQNQLYQNNSYELSSLCGNNNFQYPDSQIKTKIDKSKPKRRPRPLSLVHSFTDNTNLADNNLHMRQLLKTAPAIYTTNGAFNYLPKSAPLTPNMVSPLSPLFHHAYNQTMDLPNSPHIPANSLRLPPYNNPISNNNHSIPNNPVNKNITLPHVQELPIPTQFNPIKTSKTWLKEVLNDETSAPSNSTNDSNHLSVIREDKHVSKKPTINNLLSPYDDDEFPDSVK